MKCHWCKENLFYAKQIDDCYRLYSCNESHCEVLIDKNTNKIIKYVVYLYSDDIGTVRYKVNGSEKNGMLFSQRIPPKIYYEPILSLKFYIPMYVGKDDIVTAAALFDQNKINKYILFS